MKENHPLVSVVILTWNRRVRLLRTLAELGRATYSHREVIVIDNASQDGTPEAVREGHPSVRLISLPYNTGVAGWNEGFRVAEGKYVVVLDDDSHPAPDAIGNIVEAFEGNPRLGIVACRILQSTTNEILNPPLAPSGFPLPQHAWAEDIPYMSFAGEGAGIRTSLIRAIGGYDANFFLYGNEEDFSARALQASWDIRYFSSIVFYHDKPARGRITPFHCRSHLSNLSEWARRYLSIGPRLNFVLGIHCMSRRYWSERSVFPTWLWQLFLNFIRCLRPNPVHLKDPVMERYRPFCRNGYLTPRTLHHLSSAWSGHGGSPD